jgi:hypothetical protein
MHCSQGVVWTPRVFAAAFGTVRKSSACPSTVMAPTSLYASWSAFSGGSEPRSRGGPSRKPYLARQRTPRSRVFRPILRLRVRLLAAPADGTSTSDLRHTARFTTGIGRGSEPRLRARTARFESRNRCCRLKWCKSGWRALKNRCSILRWRIPRYQR